MAVDVDYAGLSSDLCRSTPVIFADHGYCIELYPVPDRDIEIVGR